ncbi:acetoin dehydrogenase dihydrolipoyllysine-residue acetyltransferase subunit [Rhizorhabdus argentea]|uniref:acetoin dehydrogenase dihydrolipoyllysine-residue acetyltransferase subunit n=1 Tax=Rhizorhabdus argentea TaxID=1387174 RepID=UPI0030EC1A6D
MTAVVALTMPRWGLTMEDGTLTEWLVKEGGAAEQGKDIVEVESTKLAGTVEAPASGILRRQIIAVGQTVPVGALLGVIADAATAEDEIEAFARSFEPIEQKEDDAAAAGPQRIDIDGAMISYRRQGEGPSKLVMIHGFGGDASGWGFVQQALAVSQEVVALDLPGHGNSSKDIRDGSFCGQAEVVAAFIAALGLGRVHIVAHSMGGGVALALALSHPDQIMSLTLIAPAGLGPDINTSYLNAFIAAQKRRDVEEALRLLFHDETLVNRSLAEDVLKYKRMDGVADALSTIFAGFVKDGVQRVSLRDQLAAITVPLTILWGDQDRIIPVQHTDGLAGPARILRIQGAGHMPHVEASDQVIAAVKDTIKQAAGGKP